MDKNISFVSKSDLCAGCGTCVSACPKQAISLHIDKNKGNFYSLVNEEKCNNCGLCLDICPGIKADFNDNVPESWLSLPSHPYLGYHSSVYLAYSTNKKLQFNGASGGMVTTFLSYLLRENLIDGAIVTRMSKSNPLKAEPFIARTNEELIMAQKSKYCPVPLGLLVKKLESLSGRYAVVGLPCHISAIRKLGKYKKEIKDKIPYLIGLFCSRTPNFNATLYLLKKKGISPNQVASLEYRGQGHPGFMSIKLKSGKLIKISHMDYDYWGYMFYKFFIPTRCYLCPDKVAALADISMGDNWSSSLKQPDGSSAIIVRDPLCETIIEKMRTEGLIISQKINHNTLIENQDLSNKCKIAPRVRLWNFLGGQSPDYGNLELMKKSRFLDIFIIFPQFVRFLLTRKKRNYFILRITARISWIVERINQKLFRILRIFKKIFFDLFKFFIIALIPIKKRSKEKRTKYKIIITGGFGARDIGDEAMPHADMLNFRNFLGDDLEIIMLSPNPEYTEQFHGEKSIEDLYELGYTQTNTLAGKLFNIRATLCSLMFIFATFTGKYGINLRLWPSARKVLDELHSCDLVFNVGGGNLNSLIPQELYKKGVLYWASHILGKPVIISGQTMGPFDRRMDKLFARFCLNKVHMITFRDKNTSHKRLMEIGVKKPIMLDSADDAMTIPSNDTRIVESILMSELGQKWIETDSELNVALNLKGSLKIFTRAGKSKGLEKEIKLMAEIADAIIERFKAKVVFVPTDYCPGVDDRELHAEIVSKMHNKNLVRTIDSEHNDSTLKGLIGSFDVVIGARYHFCVFSASMNVPFLGIASGIYQQTKLKGLADLYDLPQCFIGKDMEFATFQEVWPKIERFIKERELIKRRLKEITPVLKERSLHGVKEAVKLLNQTN